MSTFKTSLLAALAAILLTGGLLHYFNQQRSREAATLRRNNNRLRLEATRKQPVRPPTQARPIPSTTAAEATSPKPAASAENYRNEGRATPRATLQTFAWACDRGDTVTVSQMIVFDPAARTMAEAVLARLPEKERAQWKTVDEMAAALLTLSVMNHPFPNAAVLDAVTLEPVTDDRVQLRLPGTAKDRTPFQGESDGWKYVITEALVRAYVKDHSAPR